jgi:uncharacterized protein (TIGR02145 family)
MNLNSFAQFFGGQIKIANRGIISTISCATASHTGNLIAGTLASGVSSTITYTGGNGGPYAGQSTTSSGVTGLTATLIAGNFANGNGNLVFNITGTPLVSGSANFNLVIGGQTCILTRTVSVNCTSSPTAIVNVTSPATGKIWMDRNLGATQVATSTTDANSFGDLYQWGRLKDGHQCRSSGTINTLSSNDQPGHGLFILSTNYPQDWRNPINNNLWQGVSGINNPCPTNYRIPTSAELNAERASWSSQNSSGAFNSPLKLPQAGYRECNAGGFGTQSGDYWTSTLSASNSAYYLLFDVGLAAMYTYKRGFAFSVRCIKN